MRRRDFLALLAASTLTRPIAASAQQDSKIVKIGLLSTSFAQRTAGVQAFGGCAEDVRLHRAGAATHQDERGEQAGDSAACGHIVEALEGALDIGLLSTWPSFEEL